MDGVGCVDNDRHAFMASHYFANGFDAIHVWHPDI
jgi:hypothetical protein